MPSTNKTPNIGLNQWAGNEYPKKQDFNDDNLAIDNKIKEIQESIPGEAPVSSVNTKTGAVVLSASDIKTSSGATVESSLSDKVNQSDYVKAPAYAVANENLSVKIISNFAGKISGSVVENPNIIKYSGNTQAGDTLPAPSSFIAEPQTASIDKINTLDGNCLSINAINLNGIPKQLFSFNLIEEVKRKYGLQLKLDQLKKMIKSFTCNWHGYGNCPTGNKANLTIWFDNPGNWNTSSAYTNPSTTSSTVSKLSITRFNDTSSLLTNAIDSNGFAHFLAYTDASDGITPSIIYTDYIELKMEFNAGNGTEYKCTVDKFSYIDGAGIVFKPNVNSDFGSLNINNLGAKPIKGVLGGLKANTPYTLRYESVSDSFILQGKGGGGNATADKLLEGITATVDSGQIVGTMPNRGTFNLGLGVPVLEGYYSGGTTASGKKYTEVTVPQNSGNKTINLGFTPSVAICIYGGIGYFATNKMYDYQSNESSVIFRATYGIYPSVGYTNFVKIVANGVEIRDTLVNGDCKIYAWE